MRTIVRTLLIVIVAFLLAVPAAFLQTEVAESAETYDFEFRNDGDQDLRFRCTETTSGWTTVSPNNNDSVRCALPSAEIFTYSTNPVVLHSCPGGTRR